MSKIGRSPSDVILKIITHLLELPNYDQVYVVNALLGIEDDESAVLPKPHSEPNPSLLWNLVEKRVLAPRAREAMNELLGVMNRHTHLSSRVYTGVFQDKYRALFEAFGLPPEMVPPLTRRAETVAAYTNNPLESTSTIHKHRFAAHICPQQYLDYWCSQPSTLAVLVEHLNSCTKLGIPREVAIQLWMDVRASSVHTTTNMGTPGVAAAAEQERITNAAYPEEINQPGYFPSWAAAGENSVEDYAARSMATTL